MTFVLNPSNIIGAASGAAMALLGAAVLYVALRESRANRNRSGVWAFGSFALIWGAQVAAANISNMANDHATVLFWAYANMALLIPMYLPLLLFMAQYPTPLHRAFGHPIGFLVAAMPAAAGWMVLATSPEMFISGTTLNPNNGLLRSTFGPLFRPLVAFSVIGVFTLALLIAAIRWRRAHSDAIRDQMALVVAALLTYVSYKGAEFFAYPMPGAVGFAGTVTTFEVAIFWAGAILALGSSLAIAAVAARHRGEPWRWLILTTALVPMGAGLFEQFVVDLSVAGLNMVGLWRMLSVVLFAYAIAHYRLLGIDLQARRAAGAVVYASLCLGAATQVWRLGADALRESIWLLGAAILAIPAAFAPALRLARPRVSPAGPPSATGRVYRRRLEVYRAALEESRARNLGPRTDQHYLSVLRRNLNITPEEHRILVAIADERSDQGTEVEPGSVVGGRYRADSLLAQGSHGRVLLATDSVTGGRVVLKELQPHWRSSKEARNRLERELHLMRSLEHPRLVRLLDAVRGPNPILVLEHLPKGDLEGRLLRSPPSPQQATAICQDVADALDALHLSGVVHRDVKPANILFTADDRAKLGDLGIAIHLDPPEGWESLTRMGSQPGTVAYMSPEQARGEAVTPQSDQYSLAAVIYRLLSGQPPVPLEGLTDHAARQAVDQQRPVFPVPGVSSQVSAVVERAMAPSPRARFESSGAFASALAGALGKWDLAASQPTDDSTPSPTQWA